MKWALIAAMLLMTARVGVAADAPLAVPTGRQMEWEDRNFGVYFRLGLNTFTGEEVPTGREGAGLFNPTKLDARQWVRVAKENGAMRVVIGVKGKEGFCLWPTATTEYSVKSSPWRGGKGDALAEFAAACKEAGLPMGVQVSVEDRHNAAYGTAAYNAVYLAQLREVLTKYGEVDEVRFDGAGGEGVKALPEVVRDPKKEGCDWKGYFALVRELQPKAMIVSCVGPDARWNGNNIGHCGDPNWAAFDPGSSVEVAEKKELSHLNSGDEAGRMWCPAECWVPMRGTWFWNDKPATFVATDRLFSAFCKSTGRNCSLLFNVPIDAEGLVSDDDVKVLREVHGAIVAAFGKDLAEGKGVTRGTDAAGEAFVEVDLGEARELAIARFSEGIAEGQRVEAYRIEGQEGDGWKVVVKGKAIGHEKIERFSAGVSGRRVRLVIEKSRGVAEISGFSVFGK